MKLWLMAITVFAGFSGLALAQDTRYNFDAQADFSKYKTYKWVDIKSAQKPDDLTDRQIREALDGELAKKGLSKTDSDSADLFVGYQTAMNTEKEVTSFDSGWGYGPGWRYGGAPGISTATTSTLYVGSLDWICMTQRRNNLSGAVLRPRRWILRQSPISVRRICKKQRQAVKELSTESEVVRRRRAQEEIDVSTLLDVVRRAQ